MSRERWLQQADQACREACEAASRAAHHRQRLANGTSQDREADAYFAQQAEEDQRLAEANERDFRANAGRRK